jgi:hypothetical protein
MFGGNTFGSSYFGQAWARVLGAIVVTRPHREAFVSAAENVVAFISRSDTVTLFTSASSSVQSFESCEVES